MFTTKHMLSNLIETRLVVYSVPGFVRDGTGITLIFIAVTATVVSLVFYPWE